MSQLIIIVNYMQPLLCVNNLLHSASTTPNGAGSTISNKSQQTWASAFHSIQVCAKVVTL